MSNELGCLDSGVVNRILSKRETILLIHKNQLPVVSKATYYNAVCDYRPLKDDPYCVQLTIGDDIIIYPGDPSAPDASCLD